MIDEPMVKGAKVGRRPPPFIALSAYLDADHPFVVRCPSSVSSKSHLSWACTSSRPRPPKAEALRLDDALPCSPTQDHSRSIYCPDIHSCTLCYTYV
jgi:hypothetical protein